ncbi:PQQ-binding-like beta-propeller repeat protein [Nonomuraea sp. NPDC049269]|uniref:PQQ-binding-like beta-propeller repeat protein n=1 Tax=Nonomuraea sp. NPDC049269 TaxID=3364349 RepID=UPI003722A6A4
MLFPVYWMIDEARLRRRAAHPGHCDLVGAFALNTDLEVTGDVVLFGSDDGAVYALDASSGEQRWRFPAGGWRPRATEDPVASERPSIKAECYA